MNLIQMSATILKLSPKITAGNPGSAPPLLQVIARCARPHTGKIFWSIFFGLLFAAANAGFYYSLKPAIERIGGEGRVPWTLLAGFLGFYAGKGLLYFLNEYLAIAAIQDMVLSVRSQVLGRAHPPLGLREMRGEQASRFFEDINQMCGILKLFTASLVKDSLTIIGLLIVLMLYSPLLALLVLGIYLLSAVPAAWLGRSVRMAARQARRANARLLGRTLEYFTHRRALQSLRAGALDLPAFRRSLRQDVTYQKKMSRLERAALPIMEFSGATGFIVLVYFRGDEIFHALSLSGSIAFGAASLALYQPLKNLSGFYLGLQRALASAARVIPLLHEPEPPRRFPEFSRHLKVQINRCCVQGQKTVLEDVALTVPRGRMLAVVGPNGAGKSKLLECIAGMIAFEGWLEIDHARISGSEGEARPGWMFYAGAEPVLFNESLEVNLTLGRDFATEDVQTALARVGLRERLERMHIGLQSQIGEIGDRLSTGMRQRLVLGRMLLFQPNLLILDEVFAGIPAPDADTLLRCIRTMLPGCTMLLSTHRAALSAVCERTIFLHNGTVLAEDTHKKLWDSCERFRSFWQTEPQTHADLPSHTQRNRTGFFMGRV